MAYPIRPFQGLHFQWQGHDCAIAVVESTVGQLLILGIAPDGAMEYTSAQIIWGPGDINSAATAAGGMGNFLVPLLPQINAALKNILDVIPDNAPTTNSTPASTFNLNLTLWQYFKIEPSADGQYPVCSTKPYP